MSPVLKDMALEQQLIGHGGLELGHSGLDNMMVGSLNHRDTVDLNITQVVDGIARTGQTAAIGLGLD